MNVPNCLPTEAQEAIEEPAVESIRAWKSHRRSLSLTPSQPPAGNAKGPRGEPSELLEDGSLEDLLEASGGPVPEELVAETLARIARTNRISRSQPSDQCFSESQHPSFDGTPYKTSTCPAQFNCTSVRDIPNQIQLGGGNVGLADSHGAQLRAEQLQPRVKFRCSEGFTAHTSKPSLVDTAVLNYFQLAESVWEENDAGNNPVAAQQNPMFLLETSAMPQTSSFSPHSLHQVVSGCPSILSHVSCAESLVESSAPSTPTTLEIQSPASAFGMGSSQEGSSIKLCVSRPWAKTPTTQQQEQQQQPHRQQQQQQQQVPRLLRAEPLPGSAAQHLSSSGSCVLAQVPAADPEILGYFQYIERMLEKKSCEGTSVPPLGGLSCHGSTTDNSGQAPGSLQKWRDERGWQSQGRFSSLQKYSVKTQIQEQKLPRHRGTLSLAPELLVASSTTSNSNAESQCNSPTLIMDADHEAQWQKVKSAQVCQGKAHRKSKNGAAMLKNLFVRHFGKGAP